MEFNLEVMEEELTCPVCLELYADPLMLPCSHSMCKRCLEEMLNCRTLRTDSFECPACRKLLNVDRDKILALPKNLALENIVARYVEERRRSVCLSHAAESCLEDVGQCSSRSKDCSNNAAASAECDLCDTAAGPACRASWFCAQCSVAYCTTCLGKFHPQRGALARHCINAVADKVAEADSVSRLAHCIDHSSEQASMFCDRCKVYVCHLCVCDGEGRHAGHKMLLPETACTMVKGLANKTKEQSDSLLATLLDQQTKLDMCSTEMKEMFSSSCSRVEQQYQRFIDDVTAALLVEKQMVLNCLDETWQRVCRQTDSHARDSERCSRQLSELSSSCQAVSDEATTVSVLSRASELQPLVVHLRRHRREVGFLRKRFESIMKDKSSKLQLLSGTEQFRKRTDKLLSWFLDDGVSGSDSIIPHILSSSSKSELVSRVPSKYLTTWGFSSTTFCSESVSRACSWTVTVERNTGHMGGPMASAGYLFGIGISSVSLSSKELAGMTSTSHALVCVGGGALSFANDGRQDTVAPPLDALPVTVTIAIRPETPDITVFTYKLASVADGRRVSLVGRRIIRDSALCAAAFPVFTVSQHVKVLFPTYV